MLPMMSRMPLPTLAAALLASLPADAQSIDEIVQMKLRHGWQTDSGSRMAALHLTLAPGWKTYWRVPGDSGIPPEFDFAGSENLDRVAFHWPRPGVFDSAGLETVGYADELVLPMEIWSTDPDAGVSLRATASLGVCQDICLPVDIAFTASLPAGPGAPDTAIQAALDTVPGIAPNGVARCALSPIADGLRIEMTLDVPAQGTDERVYVETDRSDIWVAPAEVTRQGARLVAVTELVPPEARPFALDRGALRITVLGEASAIETTGCRTE
jgi:DsbC/DsbD-like thiol-disulfide interchange protein